MYIRILAVSLVSIAFLFSPASAKAGSWWEIFFPSGVSDTRPTDSGRAPFANEDAVIEELDASGNAENQTPLHLKHRTNFVITQWVQHNIPNMLSYTGANYEDEYRKKVKNFSDVGTAEYLKFLQDKNFLTTLKTGRYDVAGFIQDYPVILNEGPVDGRFRWLYQVNIMVTYVDSNFDGYKKNKAKEGESITQEFVVTFQMGRDRTIGNEHGIAIETWSAKAKKKS